MTSEPTFFPNMFRFPSNRTPTDQATCNTARLQEPDSFRRKTRTNRRTGGLLSIVRFISELHAVVRLRHEPLPLFAAEEPEEGRVNKEIQRGRADQPAEDNG